MKRVRILPALIVAIVLVLTGCSSTSNSDTIDLATPVTVETPIVIPQTQSQSPTPSSPEKINTLVGIGALNATWESNHSADSNFLQGMAYDPTPGYGLDSDHTDLFYSVDHTDGAVTGFAMNLPGGTTTLKIAYDLATKQLPNDSKLLWQGDKGTCYSAEYYSPLLNEFLGSKANGGVLFVFYDGLVDINTLFDPESVNVSNVMILDKKYESLSDSPDC